MVFSSTVFLFLFLPTLLLAYTLAPRFLKNTLLLLASLLFYAWGEGGYVVLVLVYVLVNQVLGWYVGKAPRGSKAAKSLVGWSVVLNLLMLVGFKYTNFLVENVNTLLGWLHLAPLDIGHVHLPIGVSFFTFQAMSYVIDVYRGEAQARKNPIDVALYKALFPQLIAGPIVRFKDVADQIRERFVTIDGFAYGVKRFTVGLAKKMLIANIVAAPVDEIFSLHPSHLSPALTWLGIVGYALQIYFDFSGYSDMAIGLAKMFGFDFKENFAHPYVSRSVTEFWRRWHISLSTWFRDYLYIPLGGNRGGEWKTYRNLLIVFFLCGLWHGASWTFVIWGLHHGLFLVLERRGLKGLLERSPVPVRHAYTLLVVLVGWVFFRAPSLGYALAWLQAMAGFAPSSGTMVLTTSTLNPLFWTSLVAGIVGSAPIVPWLLAKIESARVAAKSPARFEIALGIASNAVVFLVFFLCAAALSSSTHNPFIYFRF